MLGVVKSTRESVSYNHFPGKILANLPEASGHAVAIKLSNDVEPRFVFGNVFTVKTARGPETFLQMPSGVLMNTSSFRNKIEEIKVSAAPATRMVSLVEAQARFRLGAWKDPNAVYSHYGVNVYRLHGAQGTSRDEMGQLRKGDDLVISGIPEIPSPFILTRVEGLELRRNGVYIKDIDRVVPYANIRATHYRGEGPPK